MTRAVIVDVDGVVSPLDGHTAWGDDVVAGTLFGPVYTSPTMCARLNELCQAPNVSCWWLTSWSTEMRASLDPLPGRDWPVVSEPPLIVKGRRWWKLMTLEAWLELHPDVRDVAWCDDHLRPPARAAAVRRRLAEHEVDVLLLAPDPKVGLTPQHLRRLTAWSREG